MQPTLGIDHVLGVDGEPRCQGLAGALGGVAERVEPGPRAFGVDVIGRDGGDAAPVVDAGIDERDQLVEIGQVGRRLQMHRRAEQHARGCDGPEELVGRARVALGHRRARLGQEVLDDHLLHMSVSRVRVADRHQGLDALGAGLADADEDAGGERHLGTARGLERGEPALGRLVGRAGVRPAGLAEPCGQRLDHHPLRR